VAETSPTLARIEAELAVVFRERSSDLAHLVAVTLVEIAVAERAAANGEAHTHAPRLCVICKTRLAAEARRECHSCRGRRRRARERLREARAAEFTAARNGERGELARQIATGERVSVTRGRAGTASPRE
jgi:hypothetical protein